VFDLVNSRGCVYRCMYKFEVWVYCKFIFFIFDFWFFAELFKDNKNLPGWELSCWCKLTDCACSKDCRLQSRLVSGGYMSEQRNYILWINRKLSGNQLLNVRMLISFVLFLNQSVLMFPHLSGDWIILSSFQLSHVLLLKNCSPLIE
jgi:hypothetical protein